MSGKYNGVKAHIHSLNESARFVPCAAHTLNLVGVHAAESGGLRLMSAVSSDFGYLSGHSLSKSSVDELKKKAANLSQIDKADLDSSDFQSEMASFKYQAAAMMDNFEKSSPIDILQLIYKYSLTDAYPNTTIAIRIFLAIPVTVATCERSFSKLKLIKHYMRSTIGQERLSSLAIISIENEVANNIDFDDVISEFASRKARKVALN
ncbi:uncharacterized protein LOC136083295 [Hydra vulgaris]|uniref:Uncharacterized protein LOC136083295 n=1 Tax=Hydra vulgaris TaxID=6087 RepID=A0ABM4CAT2_HYDVU